MLNDTDNIYFYRVKSRDAAGRLTGHIVGNGLSTGFLISKGLFF
jgi:hypothetical protein